MTDRHGATQRNGPANPIFRPRHCAQREGNDGTETGTDMDPTAQHAAVTVDDGRGRARLGGGAGVVRPCQADLIAGTRRALASPERSCIAVLPTGVGKSRCMTAIIERAYSKGAPSLLTVPSAEILDQMLADLAPLNPAVLRPGSRPCLDHAAVVVAMQQTLHRRDVSWPLRLILDDEVHRLSAQRVTFGARNPGAYRIGWTATPALLGGSLAAYSPHLVQGPSIPECQRLGYLVPVVTFRGPSPDLQGISVVAGDYHKGQLEVAFRRTRLVGDVPGVLCRYARGRRVIGFTTGVGHTADLVAACRAGGLRADSIDGSSSAAVRAAVLDSLRVGALDVLWNCGVLIEGLNLVECDGIALCFSTLSVSKYMQTIGRGLRLSPHTGKRDLHVYDFGGNSFDERHGLVDQERDWALQGVRIRAAGVPGLRTCPACLAIWDPARDGMACPRGCDVPAVEHRAPPPTVQAEMMPVTSAALERRRRALSCDVPLRPPPSWVPSWLAGYWSACEIQRVREGYALPEVGKRFSGYSESRCWRRMRMAS